MISLLFSRVCILLFGTLYPAYISFKTVRAKKVEDYVRWMMYWIVFAIFTTSETFADVLLCWLPFYYEFKVTLIVWLLPTVGNGSSFIYKTCIHPFLKQHETLVDLQLEQFTVKGQHLLLQYIKDATLYVGRTIMNVINKNFPNGVLGFVANNNVYDQRMPVAYSSEVIIQEEEEEQIIVPKKSKQRKNSTKLNKNKNSEEPQISQVRCRRTRATVSAIVEDLNES